MMGFNYCEEFDCWEECKEHIKQNIIMAVLRKANPHSVVIYALIRNH